MQLSRFLKANDYAGLSWIMLIITLLLTTIIRLHFLEIPFERDEGSYAYLGQEVLNGKKPYIDFFERKFPVMFYAYAALVAIFGYSLTGLHSAFLVINLLTVALTFLIVKKVFNPLTGWITATAFALYSMSLYASGFTAQSEHLVIFFSWLGFWLLIHAFERKNFWLYLIAGIFMSLGLLIKQNGIFFICFSIIVLIVQSTRQKYSKLQMFKFLLAYACGGVFLIFMVFIIIWIQGVLDAMLYWAIEASTEYIAEVGTDKIFRNIVYMIRRVSQTNLLLWTFSLLGLISIWFTRVPAYRKILITLFFILSFAAVIPGFRFFGHYWLFFLPSMAVLVGVFYFSLSKLIKKGQIVFFVGFSLIFVFNVLQNRDYYFLKNVNMPAKKAYGSDIFPTTKKIADYLNQTMQPEDNLLVLGFEPQIYVYTNKQAPVRFHWMKLLTKISNDSIRHTYRDTMVTNLLKHPPDFIIYQSKFMDKEYARELKKQLSPLLNNYEQIALADLRKWKKTYFFIRDDWHDYEPGENYFAILKKK